MALLEVEKLSKTYRKRKTKEVVQAVKDVSFEVRQGEILGLLGPNGAGKTTTIKMICSLIRPDSGRVRVNGVDNLRGRLRSLRHISAVLEGNRNLYWRLSVRENMDYFVGNRGESPRKRKRDIERILEIFKLSDKSDELVNNLSRGMQQKLAIAVALLANTELILLDEPTLGLDVETGYEVREVLRQISDEGRTIIISTHDMPVVQDLCERTVIINEGRVVVDEQVNRLLTLFETRAYQVRLAEPLTPQQLSDLQRTFPILSSGEDAHSFKVNFEHPDDLYLLTDLLRSQHAQVETLDRTTINFEQVFRQLVKENVHA